MLIRFTQTHRGIPSGACLTYCTAVHAHDDENHRPIVKMKINYQMADNFDDFYINEIGVPFTETIGVGNKRRTITCETPEEIKKFFRNPLSGSLEVFSNQAELRAISNLYNTKIHIFTYGGPSGDPVWTIVGPDPDRECEAEFPKGAIKDMYLYHEFDNHYDLLVDEEKIKRLSEEVNVEDNDYDDNLSTKNVTPSSTWSTVKKHKKENKKTKLDDCVQGAIPEIKPVEGEEFLSKAQKKVNLSSETKVRDSEELIQCLHLRKHL